MSLKRDFALVSFSTWPHYSHASLLLTYLIELFLVVFAQAIQEVFTTEEWVKDARNEGRLADNLRMEASKSLTVAEGKSKELALKLATADRDRMSVKAGLRNTEAQMEEQRQRLHYTKIELAMAK